MYYHREKSRIFHLQKTDNDSKISKLQYNKSIIKEKLVPPTLLFVLLLLFGSKYRYFDK